MLREADRLPQRAERAHRQEMLALLHRAWLERRQINIAYCTGSRAGETSERVVEPYHILPYGRSWQMIAFDHLRCEIRQFKVDRVQSAELLKPGYRIPPDFDVERYLGSGWGMMRGMAGEPERVSLLFEPEAGRWVSEESWHPSQKSETLPDGRVRMEFHCGITPEMEGWLLYYGAGVGGGAGVAAGAGEGEHARAAGAIDGN